MPYSPTGAGDDQLTDPAWRARAGIGSMVRKMATERANLAILTPIENTNDVVVQKRQDLQAFCCLEMPHFCPVHILQGARLRLHRMPHVA
jgi:hypothetical protein